MGRRTIIGLQEAENLCMYNSADASFEETGERSSSVAKAVKPVLQGHILVGGNGNQSAILLPSVFSSDIRWQSDVSCEFKSSKRITAVMPGGLGKVSCDVRRSEDL